MAGIALPTVFERLPARLIGLYLEPDGTFPNHPADPLRPENLADLLALMDETNPDLGVAFDGDADRAFFIDDRGVRIILEVDGGVKPGNVAQVVGAGADAVVAGSAIFGDQQLARNVAALKSAAGDGGD